MNMKSPTWLGYPMTPHKPGAWGDDWGDPVSPPVAVLVALAILLLPLLVFLGDYA